MDPSIRAALVGLRRVTLQTARSSRSEHGVVEAQPAVDAAAGDPRQLRVERAAQHVVCTGGHARMYEPWR
jgi:hypothetical protein